MVTVFVTVVLVVTSLRKPTKPHLAVGTWSSWASCNLCLATQSRSCVMPPSGGGRPCPGQSQRNCSPQTRCADHGGNNCCDQHGKCSVWTSESEHGHLSQCCLSNTTFNHLVWPSNTSGLTRDSVCCLGSPPHTDLDTHSTNVVSAVDRDGFCCLDKRNVSGVLMNGTCCEGVFGGDVRW